MKTHTARSPKIRTRTFSITNQRFLFTNWDLRNWRSATFNCGDLRVSAMPRRGRIYITNPQAAGTSREAAPAPELRKRSVSGLSIVMPSDVCPRSKECPLPINNPSVRHGNRRKTKFHPAENVG